MKQERLKGLKKKGEEFGQETRERTAGYLTAALGLVAALAWNDAVKALIEQFFPLSRGGGVTAKFIYASILTLIVVVFTKYFISAIQRSKQS